MDFSTLCHIHRPSAILCVCPHFVCGIWTLSFCPLCPNPLFSLLIACDRQKSFVLAGFRTLFRVQWIDISFYHHNHCICVCVVRPFELREKQFGSLPSEGDLLTPPSPRSFPTSCFYLLWLPSLPPSFVALVALFHPRFPLLLYETVFPAGDRKSVV